MSTIVASIIPCAILLSIPLLSMLVVWLCYQLACLLSIRQREALEQFARIAVRQVEQLNGGLSGTAKKQLAIDLVVKLFHTFRVPSPPVEIIEVAIEAAVFLIDQAGKQSDRSVTGAN